jgi:hypothetical protein
MGLFGKRLVTNFRKREQISLLINLFWFINGKEDKKPAKNYDLIHLAFKIPKIHFCHRPSWEKVQVKILENLLIFYRKRTFLIQF